MCTCVPLVRVGMRRMWWLVRRRTRCRQDRFHLENQRGDLHQVTRQDPCVPTATAYEKRASNCGVGPN